MLMAPGGSVIQGRQGLGKTPSGARVGLGGGEQEFGIIRVCGFDTLELDYRGFEVAESDVGVSEPIAGSAIVRLAAHRFLKDCAGFAKTVLFEKSEIGR